MCIQNYTQLQKYFVAKKNKCNLKTSFHTKPCEACPPSLICYFVLYNPVDYIPKQAGLSWTVKR